MADAKRDNNNIPTLIALSNADGVTPVTLYADPTTHRLLVTMGGSALSLLMQTDTYTTTAGQTSFTLTQTALFVFAVVIGGQMQTPTADYTHATDTITLTIPGGVPAGQNAHVTYLHA